MAAYDKIEKERNARTRINLSTKYQVVCDDTAIVGVLKQPNKASGELIESKIQFGKVDPNYVP